MKAIRTVLAIVAVAVAAACSDATPSPMEPTPRAEAGTLGSGG